MANRDIEELMEAVAGVKLKPRSENRFWEILKDIFVWIVAIAMLIIVCF